MTAIFVYYLISFRKKVLETGLCLVNKLYCKKKFAVKRLTLIGSLFHHRSFVVALVSTLNAVLSLICAVTVPMCGYDHDFIIAYMKRNDNMLFVCDYQTDVGKENDLV